MKTISIGQHALPLWLVVTLVLSGVFGTVVANYVWHTVVIDLEVEEPPKILHYPKKLSLYSGETKEFNVTIKNSASRKYTVILDFSLDNTTYQDNYVTFSNETYTVVPNKQNLTAWLQVEEYAPPIDTSLTIDFIRIAEEEGEVLFFDDFNDGVADGWTVQAGVWDVINGEYYCFDPVLAPDPDGAIATVDNLNLSDGTIEATLRPGTKPNGFRQGIVFRYTDYHHYYSFEISREYDDVMFIKYDPEHHWHGTGVGVDYTIHSNINYTLRVEIQGTTFTGFINGEEVLSWSDGNYTSGLVGLRVQGSDCYFDNFTVYSLP